MTSPSSIPRNPDGQPASGKAELRQHLHSIRRALAPETRAQWDREIGAKVVQWWRETGVGAVGVYWPLRDEPDLHACYAELAGLGVKLLLPVVLEKHAPLAFAEWDIGEPMVKDKMGVAVPAHLRLAAEYPPALLVPCLGYNLQGYRLGYGGGFYDRTLARAPRPATVGVAYRCLAADFGSDGHDVALDRIITED
ncbi:5-formyltetrahydrofolate cyclo-ligase [Pseudoduganella sp. DS3]|uniref:5-formyltetrahydrofolate cyclo-ligase n=1 Tax=Pseudoduganella guangdongensis TaxID=2692179 RepID=A0A6N9HKP5_9BURK|nr:5-formyltetrahydrofolate cyclo-ligase [Pseudoduganella guangdongensis]MYN04174.1 5-formyltetrahydrofolate cyclo-ligase [Pseudoduganella guangdongensis]